MVPAVTAAELARELVLSLTLGDDPQRRADVSVQVDEAVSSLERAAASAPDEASRALCARCAESLRGLAFAVEADYLLRSGGGHPTGEQLAAADAARRNRAAELDVALRELKAASVPDAVAPEVAQGGRDLHSARSNTAVGVRAAVRAGTAATTLASTSVPSATSKIDRRDTVGYGTA